MQWIDEGIVLAARPHGEGSLVVSLLTRGRGRHAGLVRAGRRSRGGGIYEIGNTVEAHWQARLSEHLGTLRCELLRSPLAGFIDDPRRLACLVSAAAMTESALPEREPAPITFSGLVSLLDSLSEDRGWAPAYVAWELALLGELGFGLDLSRCASTGVTDDLAYVSPRSAQAVSREAGEPYRDKLLRLPPFLRETVSTSDPAAIADGLRLTGFFLERHVFAPSGRDLPPARRRFLDRIATMATISSPPPTRSGN